MWGCSLPGTRLLMNIQKPERRGLNPSLAGRPEGGPSPPRAGTGYEPGRLGGGEAPGDRPPPHCWDRALQPQMYVAPPPLEPAPPIPEPEGSTVADSSLPKLHRVLRDPEAQAPASRLEDPRYPGAQRPLLEELGVRDISAARPWRPSFLHPVSKNLGSQTGDSLQSFPES